MNSHCHSFHWRWWGKVLTSSAASQAPQPCMVKLLTVHISPVSGTEPNWHSTVPINTNQLSESSKQGGRIQTSYWVWSVLTLKPQTNCSREPLLARAKPCQGQLELRHNQLPVPRAFAGTV